jgi:hypothetical protein
MSAHGVAPSRNQNLNLQLKTGCRLANADYINIMRPATQADRLHYQVRRPRPMLLGLSLFVGAPIFYMFPLTCTVLTLLWIMFVVSRKRRAA